MISPPVQREEDLEDASPARNTYTQTSSSDASRKGNVVNINATAQLAVVLVKPDRFENAAEIADHLKEKRTVVFNLEQTNKDVARRLVDFLAVWRMHRKEKSKKLQTALSLSPHTM